MKKQYITPLTEMEAMDLNEIIAESIPLNNEEEIGSDDILAPQDNNMWSDLDF